MPNEVVKREAVLVSFTYDQDVLANREEKKFLDYPVEHFDVVYRDSDKPDHQNCDAKVYEKRK